MKIINHMLECFRYCYFSFCHLSSISGVDTVIKNQIYKYNSTKQKCEDRHKIIGTPSLIIGHFGSTFLKLTVIKYKSWETKHKHKEKCTCVIGDNS